MTRLLLSRDIAHRPARGLQTLVVRENERGGSLISIPIDEEREIDRDTDGFGIEARSDFMERYRREAGVPKAAAVLEVQGPDLR